jgi:hypothetical protein
MLEPVALSTGARHDVMHKFTATLACARAAALAAAPRCCGPRWPQRRTLC